MTTTRRAPRRTPLALAALVGLLLALTGCAGSSDESSSDASAASAGAPEAAREFADSDTAAETAVDTQEQPASAPDLLADRAVISTGVVSLRSDDATGSRADVLKIVDVHGGRVTDEETSTDAEGRVRMSRMVIRVPVADFYETVDALEKVAELESSNKSSENVSLQVIDNQVRIRAQDRSLRRIEILLDRAQTVHDIVSIESELTRRQGELDSLKSQQTYLADQTSLSTITVYLEQKAPPKPEKEEKTDEAGFLAGLEGGWSALTAFGTVIATLVGALLPWLVVVAILGLPTWLVWRRLAPGRRPRPPVPTP